MDNITLGHWLFALIGSGVYILYCLWGYKKELSLYKNFNYQIIPVIIYIGIILAALVLIS
tara:strand:+ start:172 stop:351 length:180 start_codon:yes stop_codon:yes gene_type:complete